jgi:hypothetical protein
MILKDSLGRMPGPCKNPMTAAIPNRKWDRNRSTITLNPDGFGSEKSGIESNENHEE